MSKEEALALLQNLGIDFDKEDLSEMVKILKGKPLLLARYIFICLIHNILMVLPSNGRKSS